MKKHGYQTRVEIGDCYEFCIQEDYAPSRVLYGRVVSINKASKTFDFEQLNNGIDKKPTGNVYKNVCTVRGIGTVHESTW